MGLEWRPLSGAKAPVRFERFTAHQPAGFQDRSESHDKTGDRRPPSIYQPPPHHVFAPCAQRDADADFGRPLRCDVLRQ
jgi:hypothetical protein